METHTHSEGSLQKRQNSIFFYSWLSWFLVFHYNKELTHWGEMETDVVIRSWCSKHSHPLLPYQSNQTLSLLRASFNLYFLFIAAMCSFWWHHAMVSLVDSLWASNGKMLKLLFFLQHCKSCKKEGNITAVKWPCAILISITEMTFFSCKRTKIIKIKQLVAKKKERKRAAASLPVQQRAL